MTTTPTATDTPSALATLLSGVGVGVFVWRLEDDADDRSLVLEQVNAAASRHLGVNAQLLIGKRIDEAVPNARSVDTPAILARVARSGEAVRRSARYSDANIAEATFETVLFPMGGRRVAAAFENVTLLGNLEKSLHFQAQLLDAVGEAVVATDVEQRIVFWNRFAEHLYGWRADEVIGRTIDEVAFASGFDAVSKKVVREIRAGRTWSGELTVARKDGTRFPAFLVLTPIITKGVPTGLVGVSRDISQQKKADDVLRRSEARYRALVSAVPDLIFRIDSDGRYLDYAGPSASLLVPAEQFIGRRIRETLPFDVAVKIEQTIAHALSTRSVTTVEYELEMSGERRVYEAIVAPSGASEIVAVVHEVTERKRDREAVTGILWQLEQRVQERTRDLQRLNEILLEQIDKRQVAENAVRSSFARLQTLINASPAAILELDRNGIVLSWNDAAERLFGWTAAETIGRFNPVVPDDRLSEFHGILAAVLSGVTMSSMVVARQNRIGERLPVALSAAPVRDAQQSSERVVFMYTRPESASAIDEVSEKLARLKSLSTATTSTFDLEKTMATIEQELSQSFDITAGSVFVRGQAGSFQRLHTWGEPSISIADLVRSPDGAGVITDSAGRWWLSARLRNAREDAGLVLLKMPDGAASQDVDFLATVAGEVAAAITNVRLFEEVQAANDRLRDLSRRLVSVQEEERRHIGRELHDQIGQMLTGLKLRLAGLRHSDSPDTSIVDAEALVADLLNRIRKLSLELRPPMLDDDGLVSALTWHVERYSSETGMEVDFRHSEIGRLDGEIETAAFRIVQEAMTNAARHSRAKRLHLRAWKAADRLLVEVEDDGIGFAPLPLPAAKTAGLTGMRERARLVAGTIAIDSWIGAGTRISVDLPATLHEADR